MPDIVELEERRAIERSQRTIENLLTDAKEKRREAERAEAAGDLEEAELALLEARRMEQEVEREIEQVRLIYGVSLR